MFLRDIWFRLSDAARRIPSGLRELWFRLADMAGRIGDKMGDGRRRGTIAVGACLAIAVVVMIAYIAWPSHDDGPSDTANALTPVVVGNADLPATTWTGWTEQTLEQRPAPAAPMKSAKATPDRCLPGGDAQQRVQRLSLQGQQWAGRRFSHLASQAKADSMIARNDLDLGAVIDTWLSECSHAVVTQEGQTPLSVDLRRIGIQPSTYRLSDARLVAQSVTPQVANAETSATTLLAVGRSNAYLLSVSLTFPGAVTADAITTLDTVWRAQAAKLVAYQKAGRLSE